MMHVVVDVETDARSGRVAMYGVGRKRYDSLASSGAGSDHPDMCDVWEEFAANGRDSDLEDAPGQPPSFDDLFNG